MRTARAVDRRCSVFTALFRFVLFLLILVVVITINAVCGGQFFTKRQTGNGSFYLLLTVFSVVLSLIFLAHIVACFVTGVRYVKAPDWAIALFELFTTSTLSFTAIACILAILLDGTIDPEAGLKLMPYAHKSFAVQSRAVWSVLSKEDKNNVALLAASTLGIFWIGALYVLWRIGTGHDVYNTRLNLPTLDLHRDDDFAPMARTGPGFDVGEHTARYDDDE